MLDTGAAEVETETAAEVDAAAEAGVLDGTTTVGAAVCETRTPVMLYAAAHSARDIPLGQHQVPPVESEVQKYPSSQEFPFPSGQQDCLIVGLKQCKSESDDAH